MLSSDLSPDLGITGKRVAEDDGQGYFVFCRITKGLKAHVHGSSISNSAISSIDGHQRGQTGLNVTNWRKWPSSLQGLELKLYCPIVFLWYFRLRFVGRNIVQWHRSFETLFQPLASFCHMVTIVDALGRWIILPCALTGVRSSSLTHILQHHSWHCFLSCA